MRKTLTLISLLIFVQFGFAQNIPSKKYILVGKVIDVKTKQAMIGTTVRIMKSGKDSSFINGSVTDKNGLFNIRNIPTGEYVIRYTFLGFKTVNQKVSITTQSPVQFYLGEISMSENEHMLGEVSVVGQVTEMVVKEDTIEYNPAAFKLQQGSAVEEMLKRMSGVEIDADGKITIAGKEVKKVYVNGKQMFGKDPTIATKNIPVDIIERLQVIDSKSELAKLTGIDDGEEETIINLTVKKGMNKGWMMNAKGGLGREVQKISDGENRYEGNAMINRFFEDTQLSVIANSNNINVKPSQDWGSNNGAQMGMRGGRSGSAGNGVTASNLYGTNFATAISNYFKMGGNIVYNKFNTDAKRNSVQSPVLDNVPYNSSKSNSYNKSDNLTSDFKFELQADSFMTIIFQPNFSYNSSYSTSESQTNTFRGFNKDSVNRSSSNSWNKSNGLEFGGRLDFSYQLNRKGRRLSFSVEAGKNNTDGDGDNNSLSYYYSSKTEKMISQDIENLSGSRSFRFYAAYVEPIGKNNFLQLSYSYRPRYTTSDKYSYDTKDPNNIVLDTTYSKSLENTFINQQIGFSFRAMRDKYQYTIGADVQPSYTSSKRFTGLDRSLKRSQDLSVINISPNLNYTLRYTKERSLRIDYRGRTGQPSVTQMDPTPDITNPLRIRVGNPDLLPSYSNNLTFRFMNQDRMRSRSLVASVQGSYVFNEIITRSSYDSSGVETSSYINESGNWNVNGMFMFNTPIGKTKFQINTNSNITYNSRIGYTNVNKESMRNVSNQLSVRENLGVSFRNNFLYTQARGNFSYSTTKNTLATQKAQENMNYGATFIAQITFPYSIILASDIRYTASKGLSTGYNKEETMWNAELSKLLFKKRQGTLSIRVNDILQQQISISRNITNNYIQDVEYNTLTSYFMASFAYRFNSMGGGVRRMRMGNGDYNPDGGGRRFEGGGYNGGGGNFNGGGGNGY